MEKRFILDIPMPEGMTRDGLLRCLIQAAASVVEDVPNGIIRGRTSLSGMIFLDERMVGQWEIKKDD